MTTPKEALEAARKCIWSGGDNLATVAIIDEALASLQGEDAVERVARIPHAEVDKIVSDLMSANYSDKPRLAVAVGRAIVKANERGLATGLVPDEAVMQLQARPSGQTEWIDIFPAQLQAMARVGHEVRAVAAEQQRPDEAAIRADNTANLISIIADIREKTGLGGKPMLNELADAIVAEMDRRATDEREKCAKVAEAEYADKNWHMMYRHAADVIAAAIRSGGGE